MSAPIRSPTRITTSHATAPLVSLITDLDENRIQIPPHQREYCWSPLKQIQFILSILLGYPVPSILMSKSRTDLNPTLEDGRQRLTTASRFRQGLFKVGSRNPADPPRAYSELSAEERIYFDTYQIPTVTYMNATTEDRIQIFDWAQNGAPLTVGERYHAHSHTPLVQLVKALIMTPGSGLHDRAAKVWGERGDHPDSESKDKRRNWLRNAVALVLGLVYGPANITKRYEYVIAKSFLTKDISTAVQSAVKKDLERILEIYEAVDAACGVSGKTIQNQNFDVGNFTGYMLYTLSYAARVAHNDTQTGLTAEARVAFDDGSSEAPYKPNSLGSRPSEEWLAIKNTWTNYLIRVRRDPRTSLTSKLLYGKKDDQGRVVLEALHANTGAARTWCLGRWENGYNQLFNPAACAATVASAAEDESDESETSDE